MSRYFTSDFHLGSSLINKYANRPFTDAKNALYSFITSVNKTVRKYDKVFHVGDFMLGGYDRHGQEEDIGLDYSVEDYLSFFNGHFTLLEGNHDTGHNAEADCKNILLDLNQNYKNVSISHYPTSNPNYRGMTGKNGRIHIHLCGHVHEKWLLQFDKKNNTLNVNVGVDVWNYRPVRDSEITETLDFVFRHQQMKSSWEMDRVSYDWWKNTVSHSIKEDSKKRREEKKLAKGLTPEECERRKQEGIRLSKVKKLRYATGAGMHVCQQAMEECGYVIEAAKKWLAEHGYEIVKK